MAQATITIMVDDATARRYQTASVDEQEKLQLLLRLRLQELTALPARTLADIMDEIGQKADQRGVTAEIVADLLRDE